MTTRLVVECHDCDNPVLTHIADRDWAQEVADWHRENPNNGCENVEVREQCTN